MPRSLYKSWVDRRPAWTRRVRWYEPGVDGEDIRLQFEDADGWTNAYFTTEALAQWAFDRFKSGVSAFELGVRP